MNRQMVVVISVLLLTITIVIIFVSNNNNTNTEISQDILSSISLDMDISSIPHGELRNSFLTNFRTELSTK